jgi:hypothetical protein
MNFYILYDCTDRTLWKGKTMETSKISEIVWGSREGKYEYIEHREFLSQWNYSLLYFNGS